LFKWDILSKKSWLWIRKLRDTFVSKVKSCLKLDKLWLNLSSFFFLIMTFMLMRTDFFFLYYLKFSVFKSFSQRMWIWTVIMKIKKPWIKINSFSIFMLTQQLIRFAFIIRNCFFNKRNFLSLLFFVFIFKIWFAEKIQVIWIIKIFVWLKLMNWMVTSS